MHILVAESEAKIANFIRRGLMADGFGICLVFRVDELPPVNRVGKFNLLIADVEIAGGDLLDYLHRLRREHPAFSVPVLVPEDLHCSPVSFLNAGADDYLTKPFSLTGLVKKVRKFLDRKKAAGRGFALLEYFLRHPNVVLTKQRIMDNIWNYDYSGMSNIIET